MALHVYGTSRKHQHAGSFKLIWSNTVWRVCRTACTIINKSSKPTLCGSFRKAVHKQWYIALHNSESLIQNETLNNII